MCASLDEDRSLGDDHDGHHLNNVRRRHPDSPLDEDAENGADDRSPVEPPVPVRKVRVDLVRDDDIGERFEEPPHDSGDQDLYHVGGEAAGQHVKSRPHRLKGKITSDVPGGHGEDDIWYETQQGPGDRPYRSLGLCPMDCEKFLPQDADYSDTQTRKPKLKAAPSPTRREHVYAVVLGHCQDLAMKSHVYATRTTTEMMTIIHRSTSSRLVGRCHFPPWHSTKVCSDLHRPDGDPSC